MIEEDLLLKKKKRTYGDAEWKSEFLKFSDQLEAIGLAIKDVAGDGNCLFRAMADQITGDPNNHAVYRKQICEYILHNREDFEPFIEDDEPFEEYLSRMRRNATWGGHLEIQACCMLFQVNITIHQLNQPRWELTYPGFATKTIHFSYHNGQHYSSVRMLGDVNRNGPPQTIELQIKSKNNANPAPKNKQADIIIPTEEELIIMEHTSCRNFAFIRQVLMENFNDIDASIEFIYIVGPENEEFQKEYLEKPYDPDNPMIYKPPSSSTDTNKNQSKNNQNNKNQNYNKNQNNPSKNNNRKDPKFDPEPKEVINNKQPAHESNRERKERLRMEKNKLPETKKVPEKPKEENDDCPIAQPQEEKVSDLILDLGSVQI